MELGVLFEVRKPDETLRYISESVMREVVGDRTVDEVITIGRQEIETDALLNAARFGALFAEYQKAPEVTLRRIYIETLQEVLPKVRAKIIVDQSSTGVLPLLNLGGTEQEKP